jgi:hypothetical protein
MKRTILLLVLVTGCGDADSPYPGSAADDAVVDQIGAWEQTEPPYAQTFHVRPPGQTYGAGDGSTWDDALSGLPAQRQRGARYLFASGEYHDPAPGVIESFVLDDPEQGEQFIGLYKATDADHGSDVGWEAALDEGPAAFGPLSFVTGRYVVDGQRGAGTEGFGFRIFHRDCAIRATDFVASPVFFPWDSETTYLALRRVDIEDCGTHDDPTTRSQDAIYTVNPVSHLVLRDAYVHDAWRNLLFLQQAFDILIENVVFARAGLHHEASTMALRETRNVVVRRCTMIDSVNVYISLQGTRNVFITANVLTRTLADWDNWAGIHSGVPALNTLIAGNTFHALEGLNTGIRFDAEADGLRVINNLWTGNRANQIMLSGDHRSNAFWDNWRVDGAEPVSHEGTIDEPTAAFLTADPHVDASALDLRLAHPTPAGETLDDPFVAEDRVGVPRGVDGTWDRGAFEYQAVD